MVPSVFAAAGCVLVGPGGAKYLAIVIVTPRGWCQGKTGVTQGSPIYGLQGGWLPDCCFPFYTFLKGKPRCCMSDRASTVNQNIDARSASIPAQTNALAAWALPGADLIITQSMRIV